MAHTNKADLDWPPADAYLFSDERVISIGRKWGIKGELAVVKLLFAVYRNGYFVKLSDELRNELSTELHGMVSAGLLDQIVLALVKSGFFNKTLFYSDAVLTSASIQRRFLASVRPTSQGRCLPYLIQSEECFSPDTGDIWPPAPKKDFFSVNPPTPPLEEYNINKNINFDNYNYSSQEREYGGTGEKEKTRREEVEKKLSPAQKNDPSVTVDFIVEMGKSQVWRQAVCKNHHLTENQLTAYLERFANFCVSEGRTHGSLKDTKINFNRWLPWRIRIDRDEKAHEEARPKSRDAHREELIRASCESLQRTLSGQEQGQESENPF